MGLPLFSIVLLVLGILTAVLGTIALIVAAFRESVVWGLVVLFAPFGNVIYTCKHWTDARAGFVLSILGTVVCAGALFTLPQGRETLLGAMHQRMAAVPGFTAAAATPKPAPAPDLNAQIAEKRKALEEQQAAFALTGRDLPAQYQELDKRRKALKAGDEAAITKFNGDAAAYQAKNKQMKDLQQQVVATQAALDLLLDTRSRGGGAAPAGPATAPAPATAKAVVMYTTAHCPACKMAKEYMAQKGIRYQEIDVETSREGMETFRKLGGSGVPLIMVGDKRMVGFNSQELEKMLL